MDSFTSKTEDELQTSAVTPADPHSPSRGHKAGIGKKGRKLPGGP